MADQLYGLTESDLTLLRQLVQAYRRGEIGRPFTRTRKTLTTERHSYIAQCSSTGIAAGTTAGAALGLATLITCSSSGAYTSTGEVRTVYNTAGAVTANKILQLKTESLSGRLLVDVEACT